APDLRRLRRRPPRRADDARGPGADRDRGRGGERRAGGHARRRALAGRRADGRRHAGPGRRRGDAPDPQPPARGSRGRVLRDGLASAPELAYRAVEEGGCRRANPAELAELYRLGIPCAEALAAPLVAHGELLGALVVGMPMDVQFRGDPEFLRSVADLAAASV